jgi:hypothetical protein
MRTSKFLTIATFITCLCLLYVYQQTEILRLAYTAQKKQVDLQELLDKNSILRYNIETNASLVQISNKISLTPDFQMPENYHIVRFVPGRQGINLTKNLPAKETFLSRIFSIKRLAEAKTIKP